MPSFHNYDWDNDQKWKEYLNNITIPVGNERQVLEKLKKKYYKREIDPEFDESAPPPQQPNNTSPSRAHSTSAPTNTAPAQQPQTTGFLSLQNIWLVAHVYLLFNFIMYIFSSFSSDESSSHSYKRALVSGVGAYGAVLLQLFAVGPYNGSGGVRVKDNVYYLIYCASFMNAQPSLIPLIPLAIYSFFQIADKIATVTARLPFIPRLIAKARAQNQAAIIIAANIEFMIGFYLLIQWIFNLVPLICLLLHWQFLTYRYKSSQPSKLIMDASITRIDGVFEYRLVPGFLKTRYRQIRLFFTQYAAQFA